MSQIESLRMRAENESSHKKNESRDWEWDESFPWESQFRDWDESLAEVWYRVTRRVFSEPVTSKLHILSPNILAGHLKASKVTWISAMHSIFSHPPAHSGPISFSKVENLKLASGTNKSK